MSKTLTPEDILSALSAHAAQCDFRRPDPLVMEAAIRESRRGRIRPRSWRAVRDAEGNIDPVASWPSLRTALGRQPQSATKGGFHEIAANALKNMPKRSWQALQVAIGINLAAREGMVQHLMEIAWRSQKRDRFWPEITERQPCRCGRQASEDYTRDLVELAVKQLEDPARFATHWQRASWFGFSESHWKRIMTRPFDYIASKAWYPYDVGLAHIEHRLGTKHETA